jgi:ATP-dependent RNA circularization protein (DNA/RNA ligase family)
MTDFFRFPHTPHLAWLGRGHPRDDKVLAADELAALLAGEVVVEEKVDGANVGISVSSDGDVVVQNRGGYLTRSHAHEQFRPLWPLLDRDRDVLFDALGENLMLFGEWCYACHSVPYDRLPDWFLCFDVYDRPARRFWAADRRNALVARIGLQPTPQVCRGHFTLAQLKSLIGQSHVGSGGMEGIVVRAESDGFVTARGKLVAARFTQQIEEHWSRGPVRPNSLAPGVALWR